ncbi:MAG TPA: DUF4097 family beta strand repeat-containing protein [Micromonosporaceae bacterium]|nr:DUF4097 family beta strand repeat-containing protein [Micromonosporaceae bacterium]
MPEFPCPDPIDVKIKLPGGLADLSAEERDTALVEVEPYDRGSASVEAAERTLVELREGTLVIEHPPGRLSGRRGGVRVRVRVPAGSAVDSTVASADLTCRGPFAAVTARSASGGVTVEEVAGDLVVSTASGDVRAGSVGGRLRVDSASGDVRAGFVGADAKTDSASGAMEIKMLGGGLTARTASGDCRVGVARRGTIRVDSASGDVSIGVAAGTLAWLDLSSMSGSTHNDLTMSDPPGGDAPGGDAARGDAAGGDAAGRTAEAALSIQVRTMSGDIHVHRVAQRAVA